MADLKTVGLLSVPVVLFMLTRKQENGKNNPSTTIPSSHVPSSPPMPTTAPSPFWQSLPELSPGLGAVERGKILRARHEALLGEIEKRGGAELQWTNVFTSSGPYAATIAVSTDALKLDGVRFTTDFLTAQQIADLLGVYLPTKFVLDAINAQSGIKVMPSTHRSWIDASDPKYDGTASYTFRQIDHSADVDAKIAAALTAGPAGYPGSWKGQGGIAELVNNAGKHWINTPQNWTHGTKLETAHGANYGWFLPGNKVYQPLATTHTLYQDDYSQTLRVMGPEIAVTDGTTGDTFALPTAEALTSKKWAPLVLGAEGPLPLPRHPAIPPYGPIA